MGKVFIKALRQWGHAGAFALQMYTNHIVFQLTKISIPHLLIYGTFCSSNSWNEWIFEKADQLNRQVLLGFLHHVLCYELLTYSWESSNEGRGLLPVFNLTNIQCTGVRKSKGVQHTAQCASMVVGICCQDLGHTFINIKRIFFFWVHESVKKVQNMPLATHCG